MRGVDAGERTGGGGGGKAQVRAAKRGAAHALVGVRPSEALKEALVLREAARAERVEQREPMARCVLVDVELTLVVELQAVAVDLVQGVTIDAHLVQDLSV